MKRSAFAFLTVAPASPAIAPVAASDSDPSRRDKLDTDAFSLRTRLNSDCHHRETLFSAKRF